MTNDFKNIVVYIDGTGNSATPQEEGRDTTNIHRMFELTVKDDHQTSRYFEGVATSDWKIWNAKSGFSGLAGWRKTPHGKIHQGCRPTK